MVNRHLVAGLGAILALTVMCCCELAEPEIHLIPEGYVGNVVIVLGASDGSPPEYEGGSRIYRVPANGILRTQFLTNHGWGSPRFFYLDQSSGARRKIAGPPVSTVDDTVENRNDPETGIHRPVSGAIGAPMGDSISSEAPCAVKFLQYFVGTKAALLDNDEWDPIDPYLEENPVPCEDRVGM